MNKQFNQSQSSRNSQYGSIANQAPRKSSLSAPMTTKGHQKSSAHTNVEPTHRGKSILQILKISLDTEYPMAVSKLKEMIQSANEDIYGKCDISIFRSINSDIDYCKKVLADRATFEHVKEMLYAILQQTQEPAQNTQRESKMVLHSKWNSPTSFQMQNAQPLQQQQQFQMSQSTQKTQPPKPIRKNRNQSDYYTEIGDVKIVGFYCDRYNFKPKDIFIVLTKQGFTVESPDGQTPLNWYFRLNILCPKKPWFLTPNQFDEVRVFCKNYSDHIKQTIADNEQFSVPPENRTGTVVQMNIQSGTDNDGGYNPTERLSIYLSDSSHSSDKNFRQQIIQSYLNNPSSSANNDQGEDYDDEEGDECDDDSLMGLQQLSQSHKRQKLDTTPLSQSTRLTQEKRVTVKQNLISNSAFVSKPQTAKKVQEEVAAVVQDDIPSIIQNEVAAVIQKKQVSFAKQQQPKYSIMECATKIMTQELEGGNMEDEDMSNFDNYATIYDWYDIDTPKHYRDYLRKTEKHMSHQKWVEAIDVIIKQLKKQVALEEEKQKLDKQPSVSHSPKSSSKPSPSLSSVNKGNSPPKPSIAVDGEIPGNADLGNQQQQPHKKVVDGVEIEIELDKHD